jgi:malto-oligosyltrehalose synthase
MQLTGIGFSGARAQVGYLYELGVETLYVSPILAAAPGSTHGYDVIDPDRLDPALGTRAELEALLAELDVYSMRLVIDIVPNHLAAHPANRWWWEVLRDGQQAVHAAIFDIDWQSHGGRVLVPTLSRPLAEVIERGRLADDEAGAVLEMDRQRFPLHGRTPTAAGVATAIADQHYRPSYWRLGRKEGNYRRFFDIDGLIGVRVEDPAVFEETHRLLIELCGDERVAGVRVDHIDGLADPAGYASRLAGAFASRATRAIVLVEKILARDETVPADWPVDGTTGYEFADIAGGLFVSEQGAKSLFRLGADLTGDRHGFAELSCQAKREVLAESFTAPLQRLARLAMAAIEFDEPGQDLSLADLCRALEEMTVGLEVYRTYLDDKPARPSDRARLKLAGASGELGPEVTRAMSFLKKGLLDTARPASVWLEVAQRWQQLTGAVMAKGLEDTAAYRYSGLLSHAEVGSHPDHPSAGVDELEHLARSHRRRSSSLNATSTHDSKRNEDARARLYVLSEAADEWAELVTVWHRRYSRAEDTAPDSHDELMAYETLACLWPLDGSALAACDRGRAEAYAIKAAREAKRRTGWLDPDARYEAAVASFVHSLAQEPRFARELGHFMARVGPAAATNSLALVLLKAVVPGVPDFYQGTELFEPTLTDPDNRRLVDYASRRDLLGSLLPLDAPAREKAAAAKQLVSQWTDGRIKLFTIRGLLHFRRADPHLFDKGTFQVLAVEGANRDHVVALARRHAGRFVVALVPRLVLGVAGPARFPIGRRVWGETEVVLPGDMSPNLTEVLTGRSLKGTRGRLKLADALGILPVSLLSSGHSRHEG